MILRRCSALGWLFLLERSSLSLYDAPSVRRLFEGQLITTKDADVSVELDEAQLLQEDSSEVWEIVTTHPAFPFLPDTEASPFINITNVLGDASLPYFQAVAQFNGLAEGDWPQLERAFQFYLAGNWDRLDTAMSRLLKKSWPEKPDMLVRHDFVHRLLNSMILPLDPSGLYADMQKEVWQRALPSNKLMEYLRHASVQSEFVALQKRLFRQITHLIEIRHMWTPALPSLWVDRLGYKIPDEWRLPGDDFAILRGAYQQNFELSCQALSMLVATQNAADGRSATVIRLDTESSPWIPPSFHQI